MILVTMALAFLLIACTTPDPVGSPAEAPVTQPVDTVVEPTAEAPVTAVLTATPTPAPTAMPMPTPTPTPAHAATPIPRPTPVDLTTATSADAWIHVRNRYREEMYVSVDPADEWDWGVFHVNVGGLDYANYSLLLPGALWELRYAGWDQGIDRLPHATVETVSVRTPAGDMRCERNAASTEDESVFACAWR